MRNGFNFIVYFVYAYIFIGSLLNVIAPRWVWRKWEGWKAVQEPSKTYFIMRRFIGIVGVIIILFLALFPTVMAIKKGIL